MNISPALVVVIFLAIVITIVLAQNLGTVVQIYFLGFTSLPLPLSLAMLFAFLSGGVSAALWNQLTTWLNDRRMKDTATQQEIEEEDYYDDDDVDDVIEVEYIDR